MKFKKPGNVNCLKLRNLNGKNVSLVEVYEKVKFECFKKRIEEIEGYNLPYFKRIFLSFLTFLNFLTFKMFFYFLNFLNFLTILNECFKKFSLKNLVTVNTVHIVTVGGICFV